MRQERLLQRHRPLRRRRRPGYFRVERPDQLWHMDMTSVWVAEHGWCYLNAAIDCCTREIPAFAIDLRCRKEEALAVVERGVVARGIEPGQLVLGTDKVEAMVALSRPGRPSRVTVSVSAIPSRSEEGAPGWALEPVGERLERPQPRAVVGVLPGCAQLAPHPRAPALWQVVCHVSLLVALTAPDDGA
jgi:Integrase core domain